MLRAQPDEGCFLEALWIEKFRFNPGIRAIARLIVEGRSSYENLRDMPFHELGQPEPKGMNLSAGPRHGLPELVDEPKRLAPSRAAGRGRTERKLIDEPNPDGVEPPDDPVHTDRQPAGEPALEAIRLGRDPGTTAPEQAAKRDQVLRRATQQRHAERRHKQDEGTRRPLACPNHAPAPQPPLVPVQIRRGEVAMAPNPLPMLVEILLRRDDGLLRPGDDRRQDGKSCIDETDDA